MSPVFLTFPTSEKILVPLLVSVPIFENHSAPLSIIFGTFAHVSTLFMFVGLPNRPFSTGYGGLCLGVPLFPSMDSISAVSSPQTNAPAPFAILISKLKPDPNMLSPSNPASRACSIAIVTCLTASGYSFRT